MFTFLTSRRFPSRSAITKVLRKGYGDWTLKLVKKFEKTYIKHKKALLYLQFLKFCEDQDVIPKLLRLKLLILIYALLQYIGDVKETFYVTRFTTKNWLLLVNLTENLNCCIIMLNLI